MADEPRRIPWAWPLNNRNGTFDKDVRRRNVLFEKNQDKPVVIKRPGTGTTIVTAGLSLGQGMGAQNAVVFAISADTLQTVVAPANSGATVLAWTGAGAGNPWAGRHSSQLLVFRGRLWMMGGINSLIPQVYGDIWSTEDGKNWVPNAGNAPWAGRWGFRACVLANKMYVMGGRFGPGASEYFNDVWSTEDGSNWIQETPQAPWNARENFTLTSAASGMYLIGGTNSTITAYDDVWFSPNGRDWARLGGPFGWVARSNHNTLLFKGKLYIIGGNDAGGVFQNDVWSSSDGTTWVQETAAAFSSARSYMAACVYGEYMYVFDGLAAGPVALSRTYRSPSNGTGAWSDLGAGPTAALALISASAAVFGAPTSVSTARYPTIYFANGADATLTLYNPTFWWATLNTTLPGSFALSPAPSVGNEPFTFHSFNNSSRLLLHAESSLYIVDAGTVIKVTAPAGYPAKTVPGLVVLGGHAYVMDPTGLIYNCALDNPYYWPALNVIGADYEEDKAVALFKHLNYVVALGENTIQLFYDAGVPTGSPLKPYLNANARVGCANKNSVMRVGQTTAWLSQTIERKWQVMILEGITSKPISNEYIEKILETQAFVGNVARAFVVEVPGHLLYGLSFSINASGGATGFTLTFDFATGEWFEHSLASGVPWFFSGFSAVSAAGSISNNFVQEYLTGNVRTISGTSYTDAGTPFPVYVRTPRIDGENNRMKAWGRIDFIGDQNASTPGISYTDDDYVTYSTPRLIDMNLQRPALFRNGASRRRAWVYEQLDDQPMRIDSLELSFEQGL